MVRVWQKNTSISGDNGFIGCVPLVVTYLMGRLSGQWTMSSHSWVAFRWVINFMVAFVRLYEPYLVIALFISTIHKCCSKVALAVLHIQHSIIFQTKIWYQYRLYFWFKNKFSYIFQLLVLLCGILEAIDVDSYICCIWSVTDEWW